MSVANDGVSRFVDSIVYAVPTFSQGLKASGQNMDLNLAGNTTLLKDSVLFNQSFRITANTIVILPRLFNSAGAVIAGCPQGVRLNFMTDGGTLAFETGAGSASMTCIRSSTNVTQLTTFTNIQDTDAYPTNSFISVCSTAGNKWMISITTGN